MTPYEQGFMDKCAELGVDHSALVKTARRTRLLNKLWHIGRQRASRATAKATAKTEFNKLLEDILGRKPNKATLQEDIADVLPGFDMNPFSLFG